MPSISITGVVISLVPYIIILLGLAITVITDSYVSRSSKKLMLAILGLTVSLLFQNAADFF